MSPITVAFCTFKRADRLRTLVAALRAQACPLQFDILAVNNNSPDHTLDVLGELQQEPGAPLRVVTETAPGIVPARNRAIEETLNSQALVFIDDDELPQPGWLHAACDAIVNEQAECAGGPIAIDFSAASRPAWLDDEIAGFLGQLDHGLAAFWIADERTPLWSGNIAYATSLFRNDPDLRFDDRYNRVGRPMGGGEDQMMFQRLLARGTRLRYRPDMAILHGVENWRLKRRYFLKLHFLAGVRKGLHDLPDYPSGLAGVPLFLVRQALGQAIKAMRLSLMRTPGALRQGMNATHSLGLIAGYQRRTRGSSPND
jgi:succinoglycan biosynthesis protein ExoM